MVGVEAGRQLSGVLLARLLKPFGVRPCQLRHGPGRGRDASGRTSPTPLLRYLPPPTRHSRH